MQKVKWNEIYLALKRETRPIYGSNEYTINVLNNLNINTILVQHIGCTKALTSFEFLGK